MKAKHASDMKRKKFLQFNHEPDVNDVASLEDASIIHE